MFRQSDTLGREVALLTQHGDKRAIAPVLKLGLGRRQQPSTNLCELLCCC